MNIATQLQSKMLEQANVFLVNAVIIPQAIIFLEDTTVLCSVPYSDLVPMVNDSKKYAFVDGNGLFVLKGAVSASGTVNNFKINGADENNALIDNVVTGTVGSLGSGKDIVFNKVAWAINSIVTLNTLYFSIK
jgi:hypothetical protein